MSSNEISVVSPVREEWERFAALFSEAEYVVKICEHISAKLNEPAVIALSKSGEYAADALQEQDTDPDGAVISLKKACVQTRKAYRYALSQGLSLLSIKVADVLDSYGEHPEDTLARYIPNFATYVSNFAHMRKLLEEIGTRRAFRRKKFVDECQEVIRSTTSFLEEYTKYAPAIKEYDRKRKSIHWANTWGKIWSALAGLVISSILTFLVAWIERNIL